jgi:putative aldouronate transport system substrate-binding protein
MKRDLRLGVLRGTGRRLTVAATAMALIALPACSPDNSADKNNSDTLSPSNPTTLSVWITTAQQAPAPDNKITKLLKDKLGVTIKYEIVTPDNEDQKIGVTLAGGQYPDLIGTGDLKQRFLEGGALLRLDDMLKTGAYPNLAAHV